MSIMKSLGGAVGAFFSGGTGEILDGAGTLIKNVGDASVSIREAITGEPSPEKQEAVLKRLDELAAICNEVQGRINLAEAQSSSIFVAGWRPALGWVCAGSLALYYPLRVLVTMFFWCRLAWTANAVPPMPEMGISDIIGLTVSLLGMAGLRTIEKTKEVER